MKDVQALAEGWQMHGDDGERLPARVPGCVHTDLLAAGRIPDPLLGRNEPDVAWVGRADWTYTCDLDARGTGHERTDLVLDGLDTVATVSLGDTVVGRTRNMHRAYRFDVTSLLAADGPTPLTVAFTSAFTEGEEQRRRLGDRRSVAPNDEPFPFVRKAACHFGWDWGPTLVTAGIWREARLEHWSTARVARVRPLVTVERGEGTTGRVEAHVEVERTGPGADVPLEVAVTCGGQRVTATIAPGEAGAAPVLTVPDPELWWPRGYGEQPLYELELTLTDARDGSVLDTWTRRVGFRTVVLDTAPDEQGSAFTLVVNGTRVFARGVNWIPDDVFPSRITPERYRHRLEQTAAANVDLIRVWGGGLYEDEAFYDACDELGLMVWQDFLFACAFYPEEQPVRGEVEAEARENVVRLMPHASLVLWNGNNENLWAFREWPGWQEAARDESWGEGYYLGVLPRVVAELDPTRPYWSGSPWSGSWNHRPNHPDHGTVHSWEVWNREDYTEYLKEVPRFVAEFGWQAPASYATLHRALGETHLDVDSPVLAHHQKAEDGQGKLERGLAHHFAAPEGDFDAWLYLTQLNQARAIATGIEHWRSHWPRCAGTIVWQINDIWPALSWAAIDSDGRLKPLHHELRRVYADRLLTVQERDGRRAAVTVNQGAGAWSGTLTARRVDLKGTVLAEASLAFRAEARSVSHVALPEGVLPAADSRDELLVVDVAGTAGDADGHRAVWCPARDRDIAYPAPEWDAELTTAGDVTEVRLTARVLLRDLLLQADRLDPAATTDRGRLTLLPGESATFTVRGWARPEKAALEGALFCVNGAQADPR